MGSRSRRHLGVVLVSSAAAVIVAGCGASGGAPTPRAPSGPVQVAEPGLPSVHIHGMGRDPGDGTLYLATHEGLFRQAEGAWRRVGPAIDLMGFAVAGSGRFLASGHPGAGVDLPQPAGLLESKDAGVSWVIRSRGGESDFHALTSSPSGVLAYDGVLRGTSDGVSWRDLPFAGEPRSLSASPDGASVLATTAEGLRASADHGATWSSVADSPLLLLVTWADATTAVGVTPEGTVAVSTDGGARWTSGTASVVDPPQAVAATRRADGTLEILVVSSGGVRQSLDSGDSFAALAPE
ncbi:MAG: F510_1955 family glycosylhydrolase [Terracoccus sp.]